MRCRSNCLLINLNATYRQEIKNPNTFKALWAKLTPLLPLQSALRTIHCITQHIVSCILLGFDEIRLLWKSIQNKVINKFECSSSTFPLIIFSQFVFLGYRIYNSFSHIPRPSWGNQVLYILFLLPLFSIKTLSCKTWQIPSNHFYLNVKV